MGSTRRTSTVDFDFARFILTGDDLDRLMHALQRLAPTRSAGVYEAGKGHSTARPGSGDVLKSILKRNGSPGPLYKSLREMCGRGDERFISDAELRGPGRHSKRMPCESASTDSGSRASRTPFLPHFVLSFEGARTADHSWAETELEFGRDRLNELMTTGRLR